MLQKQVICDRCKTPKKETNHWWVMYPTEEGNGFTIEPLGEPNFDDPPLSEKHLCSANCVVKEVSAFIEPPKQEDCYREVGMKIG
jgi:hypothetical protein